MSKKHVPMRTCVVCRGQFPKRQLRRFVRTSNGIVTDLTGKQQGRGAYICEQPDCLERAASTEVLAKSLQMQLTDDDRDRIRELAS